MDSKEFNPSESSTLDDVPCVRVEGENAIVQPARGVVVAVNPPESYTDDEEEQPLSLVQSKMVELYENERYSPISGWSSSALLTSDGCAAFTTVDSSGCGWPTLQEAGKALLARGWSYWDSRGQWKVDLCLPSSSSADEEGWVYASDFNELEMKLSAMDTHQSTDSSLLKPSSRMMNFVRRRKRMRYQFFNANIICIGSESFTCDHCDLQEVGKIAELLLHKTCQAFARHSPWSHGEAKFIPVKNAVIGDTGIYDSKAMRAPYRYELLEQRLTKFVQDIAAPVVGHTESTHGSATAATAATAVAVPHEFAAASATGSPRLGAKTMSSIRNAISGSALVSLSLTPPQTPSASTTTTSTTTSTTTTASSGGGGGLASIRRFMTGADSSRSEHAAVVANNSSSNDCSSSSNSSNDGDLPARGLVTAIATDEFQARFSVIRDVYFTLEERKEIARLIIRKLDSNHEFHCRQRQCGRDCEYAPVSCHYVGCQLVLSRKWAAAHDVDCPERTVQCERRCGVNVKRKSMLHHMKHECSMRELSCPYYDLGCRTILRGKDLDSHLQEAQAQHLELSLSRIQGQEATITELQAQMQQLQLLVKQQQQQMLSLNTSVAAAATAAAASAAASGGSGSGGRTSDELRSDSKAERQSRNAELKSNKNTAAIMSLSDQLARMQKQMEELTLAVQLKVDGDKLASKHPKPL